MHYLISVIVQAKNAEEAMARAQAGADKMTDQEYGGDFDWYDLHGRWGDSKAYEVTSREGKDLLAKGMEDTRREFDVALKHIRYMLDNFSDDDIYNENFPKWDELQDTLPKGIYSLTRWQFARAGGEGNTAFVYAPDGNLWGGRIENDKDLAHVLEKDNLWVVPIDFHN